MDKLAGALRKASKGQYKDVIDAAVRLYNRWNPVAEDLKDLKTKVVKVTQKRAEAKEVASKAMGKKFADSSSLIKIFESHLQEYKDMAEKRAKEFVNNRLEFLKKHDWDLDKAVPRTKNYNDYKEVENKRQILSALTKSKSSMRRYGEPDIREPDHTKIDHYIQMNVRGAEDAYRSFMQKMIEKIGKPVIDAKMTGNIWTNAILTVTTNDGEQQVWSTKMILNFSKYQKMFTQFPSRRKS
jgi:DNA modification methylase